ncbi:MAG: N(4)-(beta-N-acetylglucosaminyl)-L-asparaginase [Ferruginibacter sp.]
MNRKRFLQLTSLATSAFAMSSFKTAAVKPIVISTWAPNVKANAEAWKILNAGGRAVDAVEAGVKIPEADPNDQSVGYGGLPDRDGKVTLDACIMDELGNIGAVMALENIMHAISVARLVMDKTPHVQFAGDGALQLALANGFEKTDLLTPESVKAWKQWLKTSKYDPMDTLKNEADKLDDKIKGPYPWPAAMLNHDTIGMIALDAKGDVGGACTTSGMAYKMHGRIGDSPIIGAGLFVDNEAGCATSTGVGEEVVRICGSHTVVEMMRQGYGPEMACKKAVERMMKFMKLRKKDPGDLQVGFIALNKKGEYGAYAIQKGFNYAVRSNNEEKVYNSKYFL